MDLLLIALLIAGICLLTWFSYNVGKSTSARAYAASLATSRARERRLQADLDRAYMETAMIRRNGRGGAA